MAEPLLDIRTLTERPAIKIDGKRYEILSPDEISVIDSIRFAEWGRQINKLVKSADIGDDASSTLTNLITSLTDRIMVGVPNDVRATLTEGHRLQVADVFMTLTAKEKPRGKKARPKPRRPTGAKPARASKGSTAATPPPG